MTAYPDLPKLGHARATGLATARERFTACATAGVLRHALPESVGGHGTSFRTLVEVHEQLGADTRDPGLMLALNAHLWGAVFPLLRFGNAGQQARWLPPLLDGSLIGGHAITEPQAGSDTRGLQAAAADSGDGYVLNGHKRYITNTPLAGLMVVYARDPAAPGLSAFLVTPDDEGAVFSDGPSVKGCATAGMGDIVLTDCRVPQDRRLGAAGAGGTLIQLALELERALIFAGITGVMAWQLQTVTGFARKRRSGDGVLCEAQAVSHRIADMKLRLETARLWIHRCADLLDNNKRITLESAQTKLYAAEAFLQSSLDAAQILGAAGQEGELTGHVHDAMAGRLMSGSSEIQKNIIAAMLGLAARKP
jgi:alkylation response protein AidB-like acyl-CoA dehydrogenase